MLPLLYFLIMIIGLFLQSNRLTFNPVPIFLCLCGLEMIGYLQLYNPNETNESAYLFLASLQQLGFVLGTVVTATYFSKYARASRPIKVALDYRFPTLHATFILWVSIFSLFMGLLYYQLVGQNLFIEIIRGNLTDSSLITTQRLESYSGQADYSPGVFNQFKNFLLPAGAVSLFVIGVSAKRSLYMVIGGALLLASIPLILGTGQRTFLLFSMVAFAPVLAVATQSRPILRASGIALGAVLLFLFAFQSSALGRTQGISIIEVFSGLFDRLTLAQASGTHVAVQQFFDNYPGSPLGEWLDGLKGLIPGVKSEINMPHVLFAYLYGTDRGTAPWSFWMSTWYNLGFLGSILFSILWGIVLGSVRPLIALGPHEPVRLSLWAATLVSLAMWYQGGPSVLGNTGAFTGILTLALLSASRRRRATAPSLGTGVRRRPSL